MRSALATTAALLLTACAGPCRPSPCARTGTVPAEPSHGVAGPTDPARGTWKLRHLPKERRWAKARDDVGLSASQVERLKDAAAEHDRGLEGKSWITTRLLEGLPLATAMGDDDEWFSHADAQALRDTEAAYRRRVEAILTAEQLRAWDAGGYEGAFGRRLPVLPPRPPSILYVTPPPPPRAPWEFPVPDPEVSR